MHPMPPIQHAETQVKVQYDSPRPLNLKSTIGSSQFCVCVKLEIRTNFRCTPFHEFSADPGATRGDDIAVPMRTFSQAVDTQVCAFAKILKLGTANREKNMTPICHNYPT